MWSIPLLLLLLGGGEVIALPAASTTSAATIPTKTSSCLDVACTVEQTPVWDETLQQCVCQLNSIPRQCSDMICIPEMRLEYDAITGKCTCDWIPGLGPPGLSAVVARATATRPSGTNYCTGIACIAEMNPVYDPTTGKCTCEWISGLGPPGSVFWTSSTITSPPVITSLPTPTSTYCAVSCVSGYYPVGDGTCSCTPQAVPKRSLPTSPPSPPCLNIPCIEGTHAVGNSTTGFCTCVTDCPGIACISEKHAVYNATSGLCTCQWIPGFGRL